MTESSRPETKPIVVGLGELLWDVFPDRRRPGGAPANVAFQAGQLGAEGIVVSRVGHDPLGDELMGFLAERGLSAQYVQRDSEHATGTVEVVMTDAGHPDYTIAADVAWDFLELPDATREMFQQASAVCFGTLAQRSATTRETIHAALQATRPECLRVYDVNIRQTYYAPEWFERSLQAANVIKLNDGEIEVIATQLGLPDEGESFANAVRARYAIDLVCITRAEKGCLLVGEESVDVPGIAVDVIDAVGAGDAFTAALIVGTLHDIPLSVRGHFANAVGALVCRHAGAMPELRTELRDLAREHRITLPVLA